jgi:N-succinyl-L-ornithine transcarbamylase
MEFEFENGAIMNKALLNTSKKPPKWSHNCDIIAVRAFAGLVDKEKMQKLFWLVFSSLRQYRKIIWKDVLTSPQALADAITMEEHKTEHRPKVVLSWAPHPKSLPQAVANTL